MKTPALTLALLIIALFPACSPKPAADSYELKGTLMGVRELSSGLVSVAIAHEAIDDFKDEDGKVVGMMAMQMNFYPVEGVSLVGFSAGDAINFKFEVRWKENPRLRLTAIKKESSN